MHDADAPGGRPIAADRSSTDTVRCPALTLLAALTLLIGIPGTSPASDQVNGRDFDMEQRAACHRSVEQVRWQNRRWPDENPKAKPPLSAVMSDAEIRRKAEDAVKMSAALAERYNEPITAEMLQAEIERMARDTRAPEQLEQLFAALDNDPFLIAECLARPELARRKLYNHVTRDPALHGDLRRQAQAALSGIDSLDAIEGKDVRTTEYVLEDEGEREQENATSEQTQAVGLKSGQWQELRAELGLTQYPAGSAKPAQPEGRDLRLEESATAFYVREVVAAEAERINVRSVRWDKQSFDASWHTNRARFESTSAVGGRRLSVPEVTGTADASITSTGDDSWFVPGPPTARSDHTAVWTGSEMIVWGGGDKLGETNTGSRYDPSTDSWTATTTSGAPSSRQNHTAVWTGSEMIVWGGSRTNTGGRYDPSTDSWTATATSGAPSGRERHTAVWTGNEMIVWGGFDGSRTNTGGRYNPSSDSWMATGASNAPIGRIRHTAVWTGSQMVVWGGRDDSSNDLDTGGRYDPSSDNWTATTTSGSPSGRRAHTAVWTGTEMLVWGGINGARTNTGSLYDPTTDSWTATTTTGAPTRRTGHTAVWTGSEMIVWGGVDDSFNLVNTGGRYDPSTDSWTPTATSGASRGRQNHTAVWTSSEMIVWGGFDDSLNEFNSGGRYDPSTDSWTATATSGAPSGRVYHTAVWTGSEMIVWGGLDVSSTRVDTGGRYDPSTDSWTATATGGAPSGRSLHTAVWTGSEMIVWGGFDGSRTGTGGRYDPTTDSWMATGTSGAPNGRDGHTAVWTGSEMIVWGGFDSSSNLVNTGGRYDPSTSSWTATVTSGAPSGRRNHTAVWTGSEMIVWGGGADTGGRYDPAADSWTTTATSGAPSARDHHTAVWTGSEMIVWGGAAGSRTNTGGRYDPSTDSWTATATSGAPSARNRHTAVWTGSEMIVWGGTDDSLNQVKTGGRYDPSTDSWIATATSGAPRARIRHTAVWSGDAMIIAHGGNSQQPGLRQYGVYSINQAPVAQDDNVATDEDTPVNGDVLADNGNGPDSDPEGEPLDVTEVNGNSGAVDTQITLASGALLTQNANGTFDYGPNGQFESLGTGDTASDSYTYTVSDGSATDTATVTVTINGVDDPPDASNDNATVDEDSGTTTIDVLVNDTDIDGGPMSVASVTQPANATVVNNTTDVGYEPDTDYCNDGSPTDDFSYTLNGGSTASVSVAVTCVNDAPMFTPGGDVSVPEDSGSFSQSWASAISPGPANESGQSVSFNVGNDNNALFSMQPAIDPSGTLSFTPAADTTGSATVTVTLMDDGGTANGGDDTSAPQTFTITVTEQADLAVTKDNGSSTSVPGTATTYTIVASNTGPSAADGVGVDDSFPPELDCEWTSTAAGGASGNTAGPVSGDIADTVDLPVGASVTYTADCWIAADASGTLSNQATVTAPGGVDDPDTANNTASDDTEMEMLDFGDAPDSTVDPAFAFPTRLADDGARHAIDDTLFLGAAIDAEGDGQPDATAGGDDNAGATPDDEDGVTFSGTPALCEDLELTVTASAPGLLNAWMDWNTDGSWQPSEQVAVDVSLDPGDNDFVVTVPCDASVDMPVIGRFRISSAGGLGPAGLASDGEVEDHVFDLLPLDFGDAPDDSVDPAFSYPTTFADNGARHAESSLILGSTWDAEMDGQPEANAAGDDNNADDEDGVTFPGSGGFVAGDTFSADLATANTTGSNALACGWIDFNDDGDFDNADTASGATSAERECVTVSNGQTSATLNFTIPDDFVNGGGSDGRFYSRFRLTTDWTSSADAAPTGSVSDGEVEDYVIENSSLPVSIAAFDSAWRKYGLYVEWTTVSETRNVGFHVWGDTGESWRLLNDSMIASQVTDAVTPQQYARVIEGVERGAIERLAVTAVDMAGGERMYGLFDVGRAYGKQVAPAAIDWPAIRAATAQRLAARERNRQSESPVRWADFRAQSPGLQRITYQDLVDAGLDLSGVSADELAVTLNGKPVARHILSTEASAGGGSGGRGGGAPGPAPGAGQGGGAKGGNDKYGDDNGDSAGFGPGASLVFWAEAPDYPDALYLAGYVYRVQVAANLAQPAQVVSAKPKPGPDHYTEVARVNADHAYDFANPLADPWYAKRLWAGTEDDRYSVQIPADAALQSGSPAKLTVRLAGFTDFPDIAPDHRVQVSVNATLLEDVQFDGVVARTIASEVPAGVLQAGANTVEVFLPGGTGSPADLVVVDRVELSYPRALSAQGNRLTVESVEPTGGLTVSGFTDAETLAYGFDGERLWRLAQQSFDRGTVRVPTVPGVKAGYWVSTPERVHRPEPLGGAAERELLDEPANYLVIAHPSFLPESEGADHPLNDYIAQREAEGWDVGVYDLAAIQAQYGHGMALPQAVTHFLREAEQRFDYSHVLLVGDDSYDYRDHLGLGSVSFVPTEYTATSKIPHTPSDALLADLDGDGVADKAIGRWPVRSLDDLEVTVQKTLDWQAGPGVDQSALWVTDTEAGGVASFEAQAERMIGALETAGWSQNAIDRVYFDQVAPDDGETRVEAARGQLIAAIEQGKSLTGFVGHGAPTMWTFEGLLTPDDVGAIDNAGLPTLISTLTCYTSYFVSPHTDTLAHRLINGYREDAAGNPIPGVANGAVAIHGAATLSDYGGNEAFAKTALQAQLQQGATLGEAIVLARQQASAQGLNDVVRNWTLLGDPTLVLE